MANVKRDTIPYKVNGTLKQFIRVIKLDAKSGTFSIAMPSEVGTATGTREVSDKTMRDVMIKFDKVMEDYQSCRIEDTKVILYEFDYHSFKKNPDNFMNYGVMISMKAGVYIEHKGTAKSGSVSYDYELVKSPLTYTVGYEMINYRHTEFKTKLPWTQELEDFFVNTQSALETIILKLDEMQSPAKMLEFALNQRLLAKMAGV